MSTTVQLKDYDGVQRSYTVNKGVKLVNADGTGYEAFTQGGGSKLASFADGTVTDITAEDLRGASVIRRYAFYECASLVNLEIPEGVTGIGIMAFQGCTGLERIVIPNSVTHIDNMAFNAMRAAPEIVIGSGWSTFGNNPFSGMRPTSVTIYAAAPPTGPSGGALGWYTYNLAGIYVPAGSVELYKTADIWSSWASYIQAIPS